jgi:hypothetical protein
VLNVGKVTEEIFVRSEGYGAKGTKIFYSRRSTLHYSLLHKVNYWRYRVSCSIETVHDKVSIKPLVTAGKYQVSAVRLQHPPFPW